jgi:hypothetical protein
VWHGTVIEKPDLWDLDRINSIYWECLAIKEHWTELAQDIVNFEAVPRPMMWNEGWSKSREWQMVSAYQHHDFKNALHITREFRSPDIALGRGEVAKRYEARCLASLENSERRQSVSMTPKMSFGMIKLRVASHLMKLY